MWADHSIGTGEEAGVKLLQGALPRISPLSRVPLFRKCAKTLSLVMCLACLRFSLLFSQRVLVLSSAGQSSKMCVSRGALSRRKLLNAVNSYGCKVWFLQKNWRRTACEVQGVFATIAGHDKYAVGAKLFFKDG